MVTREDALKIFEGRLRDNFAVARLMCYTNERTAVYWFDSTMTETLRTISQCTVGYDPLKEDDLIQMNGYIYDHIAFLKEEATGIKTEMKC